jgi:hypothetical protein
MLEKEHRFLADALFIILFVFAGVNIVKGS